MRLFGKDELIGFPETAVALAGSVGLWNSVPQFAASCLAPIPDDKGHDLTSAAAHDRPQPAFVPFFIDKGPQFIGFQDIFGLGRQERIFKFRIGLVFFLARSSTSDGSHRKYVGSRAYWSVQSRRRGSAPFGPRCSHVSVRARRVCRNPYTSIVDYHSHCDHFLRGSGSRNFDICKQSVSLSCSNYTTYHFNFTTTRNSSSLTKQD